jgi:hypothetical protein
MFESGKKGNAAKKAYEIAYALFRISAKIAESGIKEKIETQAIDLLISINGEEYGNAAKSIAAIDVLVKFAIDLNLISLSNGDTLLREIAGMNETIIECLDKSDEIDVSKFFSKPKDHLVKDVTSAFPATVPSHPSITHPRPSTASTQPSIVPTHPPFVSVPSVILREGGGSTLLSPSVSQQDEKEEKDVKVHSGNPANIARSGNRQIAILDKIRQSGNCKLKEIQDILPDCSERTIRYDLEELIERELIERIGAGGPAVSYRIRQLV